MDNEWRYINGSKLKLWPKLQYFFTFFYLECISFAILYTAAYILHSTKQSATFSTFLAFYVVPHSESFSHFAFFAAGFYQLLVTRRWWEQYRHLPWPDDIAIRLTGSVINIIFHNKSVN